MVKSYTFEEKDSFSKKGIEIVSSYLRIAKETIEVRNVESDPNYQKNDIDIVWIYREQGDNFIVSIEVKTDSYTTGNFWFETISNEELKTIGCFFKSKAEYLFYYFTELDCLYIIHLKTAQSWLKENVSRFKESRTTTKNNNNQYTHTTVGRLVPINVIIREIYGITIIPDISKSYHNF